MKFLGSEKADSEVVGNVILLSLTVTGVAMITVAGLPSIFSLQDMANVKNVEQSFAVFDSRASQAIIGDSPLKMMNINLGGGELAVEPDSPGTESYMTVQTNNSAINLRLPMGKIKYRLGERIVAYEGGGVYSKYPSGKSVMISPPEFNYNGVTLTLPLIQVTGKGYSGGKGASSVFIYKNSTNIWYPNASVPAWTNPVNPDYGEIFVNITSDFYDAWGDYAKSLTYTVVSLNHSTRTAVIKLMVVPSTLGGTASLTNPINMRGLPDKSQPMDNLSFVFVDPNFNSFNWQLTAVSGSKTLIFELKKGTDLTVGFRDTTKMPPAEIWTKTNAFTRVGNRVDVDLLNKSVKLNYSGTQVGTNTPCANKIGPSEISNPDFTWDDLYITETDPNRTQSLYNITQHYINLMSGEDGFISFDGCSPAGAHGPVTGSTMLIDYTPIGALTFLHISENKAIVNIR